ncbi:hypothetical protein MTR_4g062415 [Medicago truncatula]|uniref:Reverse transcriptase zinc-binding domain-containing protein n=1 Tax=Medicago truncatula TaxID=3880 RepID=A0A072UW54_MEDTR|nr:hypothetical protein MTR_4g062415 [Medicago truncatula]
MCSLCNNSHTETSQHIFIDCVFAKSIWQWLSNCLNMQCNFSSIPDAIDICNRRWSPLCKVVVLSAVINCLNTIWFCILNFSKTTTSQILNYMGLFTKNLRTHFEKD